MPIGVAATLIGSAIAGGSAIGAAKIQSNAAKKAQQAQQTATDKALAVQQQAAAPYMQLGQQAAQRLQQTPFQPYTQEFRPGSGNTGFQPVLPSQSALMPTLGSLGQPGPMNAPQGQPGAGMVRLQAPDGSISPRPFSMQEAQQVMAQARAQGHELRVVS